MTSSQEGLFRVKKTIIGVVYASMAIFWHFLALFGYFPQFWSVFNETQDLSFFFKVMKNRGVVFSVFRFVCLLGWPQALFCKTQLSSVFLHYFHSPVKRTINLVIFFFSNFQGFTFLPWQKVGGICWKSLKLTEI